MKNYWKEQLQTEIIEEYVFLAEMKQHAKDKTAHMIRMRAQWEKLCVFVEDLLAEQKKELVNEAIETLTVDISKDKFINDGFNRWHIFESRGLEPCPECENGANIRKFIKSLNHHD